MQSSEGANTEHIIFPLQDPSPHTKIRHSTGCNGSDLSDEEQRCLKTLEEEERDEQEQE